MSKFRHPSHRFTASQPYHHPRCGRPTHVGPFPAGATTPPATPPAPPTPPMLFHPNQIRVIRVMPAAKAEGSTLRAVVQIQVGPLQMMVEIHQIPGRSTSVCLPWRVDEQGNWWPLLSCTDPHMERALSDHALAAWRTIHHA